MSSDGNPYASTATSQLLPALHHAFSGSTATLVSTCTLYPLTQVITRLQAQNQLSREGKLAPAAHGPDPPSVLLDDQAHPYRPLQGLQQQQQQQHPQPRGYAGIVDAFLQIWRFDGDGGLRAFYTGLVPDVARSALDSFLFFLFYEWFRGARLSRRGVRGRGQAMLGALEELAIGVIAGACAKGLSTPIANIASRKEEAYTRSFESALGEINLREIVDGIRKDKGLGGLWSGYSSNLLLTLNPSITFFLHEFLKGRVARRRGREPGAGMNFLLAATSKAMSTLLTYPFQVATRRLQAGIPIELPIDPEPFSRQRQPSVEISPTNTVTNRHHEEEFDRARERQEKAARAVREFAQQSIFGTMAQLVRNEGVGSLYDGLRGELLNSFLGHGTTMVVKDVMHRLLFRFYFFALGLLAELRQRRESREGPGAGAPEVPQELTREASPRSPSSSSSSSSAPDPDPAPPSSPKPSTPETAPVPPAPSSSAPGSEHSSASTPTSTPVPPPAVPLTTSLPPSSLPVPVPVPVPSSLPLPTPSSSQIQAEAPTRVVNPAQLRTSGGLPPSKIPLPLPKPVTAPQEIPMGLRYRLEWDENRKRRGSLRRRPTLGGVQDYGVNVVANLIDGTHRGLGGRDKDKDRG
ncbi:mitochondrial carrier domain-containing protein [Biscogniauxia mediterranea]|nr:mitochondrial carrier domain-containing protein [Biscogniauxia mediterranea]